jgi:hypothetical protein
LEVSEHIHLVPQLHLVCIATYTVSLCRVSADAGLYGSIYFAANLLSAVLTNNAAALLMYPIAMETVDQSGADRKKMAMVLMLAASDYITSFGYQTNLMVYGPGGYSNMDFMRFGSPMQIILWLSTTAMISSPDDVWYISWIIGFIGLAVTSAVRLKGGAIFRRKQAGTSKPYDSDDEEDKNYNIHDRNRLHDHNSIDEIVEVDV